MKYITDQAGKVAGVGTTIAYSGNNVQMRYGKIIEFRGNKAFVEIQNKRYEWQLPRVLWPLIEYPDRWLVVDSPVQLMVESSHEQQVNQEASEIRLFRLR